jgi:hypothetical protein
MEGMKAWFKKNKMDFKVVDERSTATIVLYKDKLVVEVDNCFINKSKLTEMTSCETKHVPTCNEARGLIVFSDHTQLNEVLAVFDSSENYKYEMIINDKDTYIEPRVTEEAKLPLAPENEIEEEDDQPTSPPAKRSTRTKSSFRKL